jgi:transketolase
MRSFGESAPGGELMQEFGFTVENVIDRLLEVIA